MNTLKTTILLAGLTALLITVGYLLAGNQGAVTFLVISLIMNLVSFWFSDKIALSMSGAKPISEAEAPQLHQDVSLLAKRMGIPKPKVYVIDQAQPNAFATGRNYNNSAVAFTRGIMQTLTREELAGVIAHELAHIKNRDVLLSTIAAVIAGAISSIANIALWFGGSSENRNPFAVILVALLAPIAASLIQFAISRAREYEADATAAKATGNPRALASALLRIEDSARYSPMEVNPALSSLYIHPPMIGNISNLFSTHPPTAQRVLRLESMRV